MKKQFDGIELLRKFRDKEIDKNTKIKSISMTGNEYYMHIGIGADKILYENDEPVSTGYLTNKENTFEIIEEDKKIEKLVLFNEEDDDGDNNFYITDISNANDYVINNVNLILINKINELIDEVNKLKGENDDR